MRYYRVVARRSRVLRVRFARVTRCLRVSTRRRILLFACCLRVVDFPSRVRAAHLGRVSRTVRA